MWDKMKLQIGILLLLTLVLAPFLAPQSVLAKPQAITVDLGTLGGSFSYATGINNQGQVVGISGFHAFLWTT